MLSRRKNFIREKVLSLLDESKIVEPAVSPEKIAKRYDIIVRTQAIDGDISGFIARQPNSTGAVIGLNANHHLTRRRFTFAHELGHYFLHGEQGQGEVHVDTNARFFVKLRDTSSARGADVEEIEANFFAAELLMPETFVNTEVVKLGGLDLGDEEGKIANLARRFGVSQQAMSIRLSTLGWALA